MYNDILITGFHKRKNDKEEPSSSSLKFAIPSALTVLCLK